MAIDRTALKGAYARLKGLERAGPFSGTIPIELGHDYDGIVRQLTTILAPEDLSSFSLPATAYSGNRASGSTWCISKIFEAKLMQLVSYLEHVHHVSKEIIEVGTLYNSIRDETLRNRCADLLSAPGSFDRVINQATQVLEDRIRIKSDNQEGLSGTQLVNKVLVSDVAKTVLKVSADPDEHRGFCDIMRGMMGAFRNPTHHHISEEFSREDALKVCAFVDNLLRIVDKAELQKRA
ncbi:TIGR02391 family protein [Dongia soli]|uniref:TIGR02391 family protein n=1 Tax=Dongia soli TaxID=600628 RepID=A0ABU5EEP7_9PROT|nr:TIGR02391 family protein [Dongia soli]MDY0884319.1 TIGR02391 family protein [Dongia soli]